MTPSQQKKSYTVNKLKELPFIGIFFQAIKNPLGFMLYLSRQGDIVSFTVMGTKTLQLNHPNLIRQVLIDNHKNYRKSKPYVRFESAIGLGLLTSNGDKWKRDRQKIQPLFHREWISDYHFGIVNNVSEKYKQKWLALTQNGSAKVNITEEMARITVEIILKAIFGKNISDETVISLQDSYGVMMEYLKNLRIFYNTDLRKFFRLPVYFKFKQAVDNVDTSINALAEQYRNGQSSDKYNMLALLIEAQKADPTNFNERDIRDHCATMVFAGFESTSILLQWLWYALDGQTETHNKLKQDIVAQAQCTAETNSSNLTYESIRKMDYLSAAIKEAMRLYPSFWMTGREAIEDDYFGDFKVKRGTAIVIPQFSMHRHPDWWENADSFMPDRFLSQNIDEGLYFPFSQGPRKCAGYSFAEMEAKTVMAKLLPLFKVTALNKKDNPLYPGVSLKLTHPLQAEISRA